MAERMMISSAIANNLGCTWLKGFDASEIQPLVQTLQEIVGWFNRPTIENVENFPSSLSTVPASASFFSVYKCI